MPAPHELIFPGTSATAFGPDFVLQCVVMDKAPADKACIDFAAAWCINTLIISYYKSFL